MFINFKRLEEQECEVEIVSGNNGDKGVLIIPTNTWTREQQEAYIEFCSLMYFTDKERDTLRGHIYGMRMLEVIRKASDL